MKKFRAHNVFRQAAALLIAGSLLCVLFGEGAHLHSVLDHLFDHGDIHTIVHAHPADETATDSAFHGDENHQHEVASVDLNGIFTQSGKHKVTAKQLSIASTLLLDVVNVWANQQSPTLFDLPPPEHLSSQYHSYSFLLRGPPIA